ncbi:MAG: hypothetical protein ACKV2V_29850, partial [Blastocatellia bacterium]
MLTPQDISRALAAARAAGEALAIVSRLETAGSLAAHAQRLLVGEQGAPAGGTLGSAALDKLAATHAATLIADEKQEITTAHVRELLAAYEMDADAQEAET